MTEEPDHVAYFGYGSLVNELTWARPYQMQPAEVNNWTREWKHCVDTPFGKVCALTASRSQGRKLQGVLIRCTAAELHEVDLREIGYQRDRLESSDIEIETAADDKFIYRSKSNCYRDGDENYPLWLSYIEVVLFGYLRVFGEEGVDQFIATTSGWDTPVLDDRLNPIYPRAGQLTPNIRSLIDRKLESVIAGNFIPR